MRQANWRVDMEGFTREELKAVGAIPEWSDGTNLDDLWNDHWEEILGEEVQEHRNDLVRLAIAHPERAHLALGDGWKSDGQGFIFEVPIDGSEQPLRLIAKPLGLKLVSPLRAHGMEDWSVPMGAYFLPPEFDAALVRARRISAALAAIQAEGEP